MEQALAEAPAVSTEDPFLFEPASVLSRSSLDDLAQEHKVVGMIDPDCGCGSCYCGGGGCSCTIAIA
jgi:hypothetical protein